MAKVRVAIIRYVSDEPQPGLVECQLVDAHGRRWSFVDKTAVFSEDDLNADSSYPQPGAIACEVIGRVHDTLGHLVAQIDTERPWYVGSIEGTTRLEVLAESLAEE